jgi:hypothetical protein
MTAVPAVSAAVGHKSPGVVINNAKRHAAGTQKPRIAPPQSRSHGHTYGEWSAIWWQWVLGIPADRNPLTDPDGRFCAEEQSGPVWFLAGTFGTSVERSCTIPTGRAIFMPAYNWIFGAGAFDCDPSVPGVACDVQTLQAAAAANTEKAAVLDVFVDGVRVDNPRQYRGTSPMPFSITYPESSVTGLPAGTYYPQVSDGYWLLLHPLPPGQHTISIRLLAPDTTAGTIDFLITHHITVR